MTLQDDRQRRDCPPVGHPFDLSADALARDTPRAGVPSRLPLDRSGRPSDLAGLAAYLASAAGEYHTGDVLTVDGGYGSC